MSSPNEIKKGTVLRLESGDLGVVMDFQRVSPGKGSSFVRTRIKNLKSGKTGEVTYKSSDSVTFEDVLYKKMQYLYNDGMLYTFMDNVSYEQIAMSTDEIGEDAKYLKDGLEVTIAMHEAAAVAIELPQKIQYTVTLTQPAVKGDTASGNVQKDAELDNGLKVRVPIFIRQGDEILVNTQSGEYTERVNK